MRRRGLSNLIGAVMLIAGVGFVSAVSAQPTDAQIKRDLTGPRTVSVVLGKPGTREWSSTYKKYVWNRNFTAKLRTEDPRLFVIVKGYASYDIIGRRFAFWRTFTTSNSYERNAEERSRLDGALVRAVSAITAIGERDAGKAQRSSNAPTGLRLTAPGCRFGYPGERQTLSFFNRNAVASS